MRTAELKLKLLLHGVRLDMEALSALNYKSDKHFHNDRHYGPITTPARIPQEVILCKPQDSTLCVSVLVRPMSPFLLTADICGPYIEERGKRVNIDIVLPPEPVFWSMATSDKIPMSEILSLPGLSELSLWTWHDCSLQRQNLGCLFCTTSSTADRYGKGTGSSLLTCCDVEGMAKTDVFSSMAYRTLLARSTESVTCALREDFNTKSYWFTVIGGSLTPELSTFQNDFFSQLISDLIRTVPQLDKERIVCNAVIPQDVSMLETVKHRGARYYMANLELWGNEERGDVYLIL